MHALKNRASLAVTAVLLVIALSLNLYRMIKQYDQVGGPYDNSTIGLFDFHNGIYTPTRAFLDGVNPYGQIILDQGYPVARPTPIYGPSHFLIHAPIAWLPVRAAEVVYCCINLGILATMVFWPLNAFRREDRAAMTSKTTRYIQEYFWHIYLLCLAALLLSRPGHLSFVSGYFTAELAFGAIATIALAKDRPWLSGCAFLLACGKPTYALPILCVLVVLQCYQALFAAIAIGGAANLIALGWLLRFESLAGLVQGIREGQAMHMADPIELPVNSWLRIDWTAIVSKWIGADPTEAIQVVVMCGLYLAAIAVIRATRTYPNKEIDSLLSFRHPAFGLCMGSILLFVYHHVYDALVLAPTILMLMFSPQASKLDKSYPLRFLILILLTCPFWNYAASETVLSRLPESVLLAKVLTSMNTVAVTLGLGLLIQHQYRLSSSRKASQTATSGPV